MDIWETTLFKAQGFGVKTTLNFAPKYKPGQLWSLTQILKCSQSQYLHRYSWITSLRDVFVKYLRLEIFQKPPNNTESKMSTLTKEELNPYCHSEF